jgi:uncharacterized protein (DUF1800 family)
MAENIPSIEPIEINAGNTVKWTKSLSEYPADDSWVLAYRLIGNKGTHAIASSASGKDHAVIILATASAAYQPGDYRLIGQVSKGTEVRTVYNGSCIVHPNLYGAAGTIDTRSLAKQNLDKVEAAILANADSLRVAINIDGQVSESVITKKDFRDYRNRLRDEYEAEQEREQRARTGVNSKRLGIRFGRI